MRGEHPSTAPDLSPRKVLAVGSALLLALLLIDLAVTQIFTDLPYRLRRFLDLTKERNLPTAISVTLLAMTALVSIRLTLERLSARAWGAAAGWLAVGAFFAYMAVDDALRLHEEKASAIARSLADEGSATPLAGWVVAFPSYHWIALFVPLFGAFGLFILAFAWRQLAGRRERLWVGLGLACYTVAVGLDFLEGADALFEALALRVDEFLTRGDLRHLMRAYEETIEMLGTLLILSAFLAVGAPGPGPARKGAGHPKG